MDYARAMRTSALFVGGPLGLLVTGVRSVTALPPPESADWDELEAHQTRLSLRLARAAAAFIIGFVVVFWGLDLLLRERPPAEQAIYTTWRLSLIGVFGAMYLTLTFLPLAQRHPALASAPFSAAASAALAFHVGRLGGLERPFFNMMCASLIIIIAAPASLPVRVAFLIAQSCGLIAGFFGPHVEYADTPELIESLFFFGVLFAASVTAGHLGYVNFCHSFFQGLKLERTARELDTLNRELGLRVREKTASLRQLAEHLQVVQEDERGRFARELHDELGQRLSAMRYVVARTRQDGARASAAHAPDLEELDGMLDDALHCTRYIVTGLRPPLLDQVGLAAAIEWLAKRTSAQTGLRCTLDLTDDLDGGTDPAVSVAAYRVLQESLTNIMRHADAAHATIRLRVSPERLDLEVTDDGCGFPAGIEGAPSGRNGLLGMRERATALGGELRTDNAPAGGARVRLNLPRTPATAEVPA
jgi:signal transduction histidine kinase